MVLCRACILRFDFFDHNFVKTKSTSETNCNNYHFLFKYKLKINVIVRNKDRNYVMYLHSWLFLFKLMNFNKTAHRTRIYEADNDQRG